MPVVNCDELRTVVGTAWCRRVDAEMVGQWAGEIGNGVAVAKYITGTLAHGLKAEQAPPVGWKGHRTSQTGGYLVRPAAVLRQEARRALHARDALRRAIEGGLSAHDAELAAHDELERADATTWRLFRPGVQHQAGAGSLPAHTAEGATTAV